MRAFGKGSIASLIGIGLHISWIVLWACLGLLVVGGIGYGILLGLINAGMVDASILTGGDGEMHVGSGSGNFHLTYDGPNGATWPVVVPVLLIGAVALSGAIIIVGRLRKLMDNFVSGEPFAKANAQHLRVIWITMLVIEVARYLLMGLAGVLIATFGREVADNADISFRLDLSTWGSILILIVLAEVFREGARLKEEQELTI